MQEFDSAEILSLPDIALKRKTCSSRYFLQSFYYPSVEFKLKSRSNYLLVTTFTVLGDFDTFHILF